MKRNVFLIITSLIVLFTCVERANTNTELALSDTTVVVNQSTHDFGIINESDGKVEHEFIVTNHSDSPLLIEKVSTSCGCTASGWTKEPIKSGENGIVKITFNPKSRKGNFHKTATVITNGNPSNIRLTIKGKIE